MCMNAHTHTHTHTHMHTQIQKKKQHICAHAHTHTNCTSQTHACTCKALWVQSKKKCGLKKVLQAEDLRWADGRWRNLLSISTWVELVRQNTGGWDQRDRREGAWFLIDLIVRRRILYETQDSSGSQCGAQRIRDNYNKLCGQTWQNV